MSSVMHLFVWLHHILPTHYAAIWAVGAPVPPMTSCASSVFPHPAPAHSLHVAGFVTSHKAPHPWDMGALFEAHDVTSLASGSQGQCVMGLRHFAGQP